MFKESAYGAYNFNVLRGILEMFNLLRVGIGVEVGVFDGGTSWYLLDSFPDLRLVSVDPYTAYAEYDQDRMDQAERTATQRLEPYGDRSIRMKTTSILAAQCFPPETFDFVFIDGDHSYEGAKQDIEAWYPTVRSGGLFSGHDYRWEGVGRAIEEFAQSHSLRGNVSPKESDIWWIIKP